MRTVTKEELSKILENHTHWLEEDCEGWQSMCADLHDVDLHEVDLHNTNLRNANLGKANLHGVNLRDANLSDAHLSGADLSNADLVRANLSNADLGSANLSNVNLMYANLSDADLYGANLSNVTLRDVNLYGADLREAKNVSFIPLVCPSAGKFTGWKKALIIKGLVLRGEHLKQKRSDVLLDVIIELEIPADAKRSSSTTRKCRCDKAVVKSITSLDGTDSFEYALSSYDNNFVYRVGEMVSVDDFDEDRFNECAPGIHFFIDRQEAIDY